MCVVLLFVMDVMDVMDCFCVVLFEVCCLKCVFGFVVVWLSDLD